jgi:hypothetical protein
MIKIEQKGRQMSMFCLFFMFFFSCSRPLFGSLKKGLISAAAAAAD